ncbi:allergin-1 [Crotalus tigris]|uniref:allergin-1 n=1 Tax=Crotalus tigris TaxID=88082 RepID=UPI00192F5161|nr:allergin-1 [Crotalus tigris]
MPNSLQLQQLVQQTFKIRKVLNEGDFHTSLQLSQHPHSRMITIWIYHAGVTPVHKNSCLTHSFQHLNTELSADFTVHLGVRNSKEHDGVNEDNRANSQSPQNCSKVAKVIKIYSPIPEITIGGKVTLVCYWETDCLPINYVLFLNKIRVQGPAPQSMKEEKVVFNITIHSSSQLGPYKCKAEYRNIVAYSLGFNFTLRESNNLAVFIVPPLILLLLLIAAVVTIRLLILPWCKARKLKAANISTAYDDTGENQLDDEHCVAYGVTKEPEYCNMKMKTKTEDYRYVNDNEDSTVTYAEVICR